MDSILRLPLSKGYWVKLDLLDLPLVRDYAWHANIQKPHPYAATNIKKPGGGYDRVLMHHLFLPKKPGLYVDHINGDTLDNRRSNLRYATPAQNTYNTKLRANNTTGYRGVTQQRNGRWKVIVGKVYLGLFDDLRDAVLAYNAKALELFGDFARPNPVPE